MNLSLRHLLLLSILSSALSAQAATDTANMNVKITVTATCDIHTSAPTDVNFGTVASTATNVQSTGGVITANCTSGTAYSIGLGNGSNFSTTRRMIKGTTDYVAYGLYRDSARTLAWGTTTGAGGDVYTGTGSGANQAITVYGLVPSANSPAGSYSDTVVATVTY